MPRYIVERSFPVVSRIPLTEQGAQACDELVRNNAEGGVTWVHSYVKPACEQDLLRLRYGPSPAGDSRSRRQEQPTGRHHHAGARARPVLLPLKVRGRLPMKALQQRGASAWSAVALGSCCVGRIWQGTTAPRPPRRSPRRCAGRPSATRPSRRPPRAGYALFLGCVSSPQDGAMGIHYVNGDLVGDGKLDASRPEALMYEPKGGKLELVGVEYIVHRGGLGRGQQDAAHADGPALPLRHEPQPLRHPGLLRAARVGVAAQPARDVRGLQPARVLRRLPDRAAR